MKKARPKKNTPALIATIVAGSFVWWNSTVNATLIAHWTFDNSSNVGEATVSDNLTASGGGATYTASGKIGGALSLDGSAYLRVDASDTLPTGLTTGDASFTQSAWIQTSNNASNGIIGWGNYGSAGQVNAFRTGGGAALTHYSWGGGFDLASISAPQVYDGGWHHVAATYDSATSTKTLYFDGGVIGSTAVGDLNVGGVNFRLGNTNFGEFFSGSIDDVRVYDTALSAPEIMALAIPEPSSFVLLGMGLLVVLRFRWQA